MDIRKVKKLIELMEESDITEIEIKEGEDAVRISRATRTSVIETVPTLTKTKSSSSLNKKQKNNGDTINAPMVGTFYQSPSPDAPAFVQEGSEVLEGDTLCIIESMKMMNQIKADRNGRIEAVLVSNEDVVEFDQALFSIV